MSRSASDSSLAFCLLRLEGGLFLRGLVARRAQLALATHTLRRHLVELHPQLKLDALSSARLLLLLETTAQLLAVAFELRHRQLLLPQLSAHRRVPPLAASPPSRPPPPPPPPQARSPGRRTPLLVSRERRFSRACNARLLLRVRLV